MKRVFLLLLFSLLLCGKSFPCNVCGGGTSDVAVLSLDGKVLFNLGLVYDKYLGNWDNYSLWHENKFAKYQVKATFASAYRLNNNIQFGISIPYVLNYSKVPGVKKSGKGLGDISVFARYEFFHEHRIRKVNGKPKIDNVFPYLALTMGISLPTGKSDENAESEVDVTGKGYYSASLGISVIKSIIRNKLQVSTDLSWQHAFEKSYIKYFGEGTGGFNKKAGDKFNYSMTLNYIINSQHAISFTTSGFFQNDYIYNGKSVPQSDEKVINFTAAYTFYPHIQLRVTPLIKWNFTGNDFGKNTTGSTSIGLNLTYYIPDYKIK